MRGCFPGCYGESREGAVMFDQPLLGRVVAPKLTAAFRKFSNTKVAGEFVQFAGKR